MIMQTFSREPDFHCSFNLKREARFAPAAVKSQNVGSGAFQTRVAELQTNSESLRDRTQQPMVMRWLKDALENVDQIDQEAEEEDYPPIGDVAKRNAKSVLFTACQSPLEPHVYASMDGEIGVYFKSPVVQAALLILLNNDGGAGVYWSVSGKSKRQHYDDASELPIDLLHALGGLPLSQFLE